MTMEIRFAASTNRGQRPAGSLVFQFVGSHLERDLTQKTHAARRPRSFTNGGGKRVSLFSFAAREFISTTFAVLLIETWCASECLPRWPVSRWDGSASRPRIVTTFRIRRTSMSCELYTMPPPRADLAPIRCQFRCQLHHPWCKNRSCRSRRLL